MEKKKRHRRTKAEMIAARAAKAQKNAEKYLEKVEKKMTTRNSGDMKIIPWPPKEQPDDGKFWEFHAITGTEAEMNEFYKENKENVICGPYLYSGNTYRVTYWKERT
ncbi:MAG: hypothetical protein MJ211_09745 [Bacteroidales bacterium]|nr:hypothetical protein [Bacteroidales bacterium]